MLQNSRVTALTVFELLRENQLGGNFTPPPPSPTQIRVKCSFFLLQDLEVENLYLHVLNAVCDLFLAGGVFISIVFDIEPKKLLNLVAIDLLSFIIFSSI